MLSKLPPFVSPPFIASQVKEDVLPYCLMDERLRMLRAPTAAAMGSYRVVVASCTSAGGWGHGVGRGVYLGVLHETEAWQAEAKRWRRPAASSFTLGVPPAAAVPTGLLRETGASGGAPGAGPRPAGFTHVLIVEAGQVGHVACDVM